MQPTRLFDFIQYQKENYPQEKAFGHRSGGEWKYYSTAEMIEMSNQAAAGLLKMGVKPGEKIALVSYQNRPEWTMMDLAMLQIGVISVPVYPTISPREYEYIFNDATVTHCFCGDGDLVDKVRRAQLNVPSLKNIYSFDPQSNAIHWKEIFDTSFLWMVETMRKTIKAEDLATIIYTSGTTGDPKGVMLSHDNIVSNVLAVRPVLPVQAGQRVLSFLPLCHIFERVCSFAVTYIGASVTFVGTDNLGGDAGDLKAVRPHFFTCVPRLLEKVYEKIYGKGLELKGVKRKLFFWALSLTNDYEYDKKYTGWAALQRTIADKLIFSKWREAMGGEVQGIVTGASPCPAKMARIFSAAGIPIREGYGLTESSPGICINRFEPNGAKIGTVGPVLNGIEIMIDRSEGDYREGEGEVLSKGPNTMMGYYNKPDKTDESIKIINGERWLRTGDVGTLTDEANGAKFLKITDRKKELLKTSGGKYVAPAPIEGKFKEDFLIEQIMVIGDAQKFVSAFIVPAKEVLKEWCNTHAVAWTSLEDAIAHPKVQARYQASLDRYNPNFSHIEQIKKFKLLNTTWDAVKTDGTEAELTPTMKLKRRVILQKYSKEIEEMYG